VTRRLPVRRPRAIVRMPWRRFSAMTISNWIAVFYAVNKLDLE
jgi:hypothetical protein